MARLTDEELERLLRETFADKEGLPDQLPKAIKSRRLAPVVLAAAAALVVITGILYGVSRGGDPDPSQPVATASATGDADVWAAAVVAIARKVEPADGWQLLRLRPQGSGPTGRPQEAYWAQSRADVPTISAQDRDRIGRLVAVVAPAEWEDGPASCGARRVATVTVGAVADKGDHKEVSTAIAYGCGPAYEVTYRVEQQGGVWKVTATVGASSGVLTSGAGCPMSRRPPASPGAGC